MSRLAKRFTLGTMKLTNKQDIKEEEVGRQKEILGMRIWTDKTVSDLTDMPWRNDHNTYFIFCVPLSV